MNISRDVRAGHLCGRKGKTCCTRHMLRGYCSTSFGDYEEDGLGTPQWPSDEVLDALHMSLGRLVTASAQMELHLRGVVGELAEVEDAGWIVFEGQSVDWLVNMGKALLKEHREMERWPAEFSDAIGESLAAVGAINLLRNRMVHGAWSRTCLGASDCVPRPQGAAFDDRVFHVYRSRNRKGVEEHQVAVCDIQDLVQRIYDVIPALRRALRAAQEAYGAADDVSAGEPA
ncbi:hypothetical protein ACIF80_26120 [Streptomyces sp. NPDC085927]|uniref:hypothetical protein n=1 Tax=Streptomyces sp. NPDC085927 TaxID=3365738 RepID=UPI0037D60853